VGTPVSVCVDYQRRALVAPNHTMTHVLNFALKSADEQQSIIMQFQNFLNSLDFSVQIFIQSRKLDIRPYIALLEGRLKEQMSELLKIQTREYMGFIKYISENSNIMTKTFFIVVPYSPATLTAGGVTDVFGKKKTATETAEKKVTDFEEHRSQLEQRVSVVTQGLVRCGIRTVELGTEEIVELFYKIFNPGDTEKPIALN
jgi:type IV secretory pathway VirB4 component